MTRNVCHFWLANNLGLSKLWPCLVAGMGEVYCARDTKLKREVAIRILPDEFSHSDRVARSVEGEPAAWNS